MSKTIFSQELGGKSDAATGEPAGSAAEAGPTAGEKNGMIYFF